MAVLSASKEEQELLLLIQIVHAKIPFVRIVVLTTAVTIVIAPTIIAETPDA